MYKKIHIFRVKPGQELVGEILKYCQQKNLKSGVIISLLGSLKEVELGFLKKLPGHYITKKIKGPLEIACGTGTIALKDNQIVHHIHIVVSNEKQTWAGHLSKGIIFSTAEVVFGELKEQLERSKDSYTGLNELKEK